MASVKVAVRVRPFNKRERDLKSACIVEVDGMKTRLTNNKAALGDGSDSRERNKDFTFDYSYWSHREDDVHFAPQVRIYDDLGTDVVSNALQGYNACVFAYGQTGSGKTFTMMGCQSNPGLIPRICEALFSSMAAGREAGTTYKVEVSYLEIYNERVKDLLQQGSATTSHSLRVREHPKLGPYVEALSNHIVHQYTEIQELMARGNSHRTTASTHMNDTSSRSHAIFTVTFIQARLMSDTPLETRSKVHLVDLAGSERADATGATGQRLKEGAHINKSLVTLGSVISALAEQASKASSGKSVFIPYRDSVLTWLLKDSLGGNSKTIMIATISPADVNYGETLSTLRYANRAKNIINKPTINEDPNVKLIRELREEIHNLKSMMSGVAGGGSEENSEKGSIMATLSQKQAKEKELTDQWTERWKETHTILQEQKTLGLRKAGQGVVLDSEQPHLVLIDDNLLTTGVTLYHLNDGTTTIGSLPTQDIRLEGGEVLEEHCIIHLHDGSAVLESLPNAQCWVNSQFVDKPSKLTQGCVVVLGGSHMFRYNDPQEAARLRKEGNKTHLNLSRLSFLSRSTTDLVRSYDNLTGLDIDADKQGEACNVSQINKRLAEPADLCEMSTQTSLHNTHSHPSTPIGNHLEGALNHAIRKSSLTLPLAGGKEEVKLGNSSVASTPASDTFYTATSFLSPDLTSPLSPLPLDAPESARPNDSELAEGGNGALSNERSGCLLQVPMNSCMNMVQSERRKSGLSLKSPVATPDKEFILPVQFSEKDRKLLQKDNLLGTPDCEGAVHNFGAFLTSPIPLQGDYRQQYSPGVEGQATSTPVKVSKIQGFRPQDSGSKNVPTPLGVEGRRESLTSYSYKGSGNESSYEVYSATTNSCYTDAFSSSPSVDNSNRQGDNNNISLTNGNLHHQASVQPSVQASTKEECLNGAGRGNKEYEESVWHSGLGVCEASALISPDAEIAKASKVLLRLREGSERADSSVSEQIRELETLKEHYCNLEDQLLRQPSDQPLRLAPGREKEDVSTPGSSSGHEDLHSCDGPQVARPTHLPLDSSLLQEDRITLLIEREVQRRVLEEVVALETKAVNSRQPPRRQYRSMSTSVEPWSLGLRVLTPSEVRPYTSMSAGYEIDGEIGNHLYQSATSADDLLLTPALLQSPITDYDMSCGICVCIPGYEMRGAGTSAHWEFEVKLVAGNDSWTVFRRYRRFRELHHYMCHKYGQAIEGIYFPPRRLFGNFNEKVVAERRGQLEVYLQQLIVLCSELEGCPLYGAPPCRATLASLSPFFQRGVFEGSRHTTS